MEEQVDQRARHLLTQMSLKEKIQQMSGSTPLFPGLFQVWLAYNKRPLPSGGNARLSIPAIYFSDGPRGVVMNHSTCFPVTMARGASWDTSLEERIGDAMGVEARSLGANFMGSVCINLLRHPAWGRAQETYGEDPCHLGEMGSALMRGIQRHAMACIKHYAANSIENTRFRVDVRIGERTLREIYLPHFKRCVDEGAACVMSAYNKVNGRYCGHNPHLLDDILRKEWGFDGPVMSDFVMGIRSGMAANDGMDIEMPLTIHFGWRLMRLVKKGKVPVDVIDRAVLRILRRKIRFAAVGQPERYRPGAVVSPEHRALAREAARKSMVLLKNEPVGNDRRRVLPVDTNCVKSIAVIGRLAAVPNIGDRGSSMARPPHVVTPLEGIRAAFPRDCDILYDDGRNAAKAAGIARRVDAAIVIAGYTHRDEGEYMLLGKGGDRDSLALRPRDEALILKVAAANPHTAVVMVGGSAIITEAWRDKVPAILMAWYPGMEGGHALADILLGKANPGGKLPCVFPKSKEQLPFFDKRAKSIDYGYYHGYRLMDKQGQEPAFPFGFGLSYTTFACKNLQIDRSEIGPDEALNVSVDVTNTGNVAGDEVLQLYAGCEGSCVERPVKELKGFSKVHLEPGETKRVDFTLAAGQLACYDEEHGKWIVEPIDYTVYAGPSSRKDDGLSARFCVRP